MQATTTSLINQATRIADLYKIATPDTDLSAYLLRRYNAITNQLGYDPLA
jgi:hypothetical protein